jgi:hypothetical protein
MMRFPLASDPFGLAGSIIAVISGMHIYQACLLLWGAHAGNATALRAVIEVFRVLHNPHMVAGAMMLSAVLAIAGTLLRLGWARLLVFLIPQNIFAGAMAYGGLVATYNGTYLDGTQTYPDGSLIGRAHISGDQIAFMAIFITHISATVWRCRDRAG